MRVTFILGCIAVALTATAVIFGMIWRKLEWGDYWGWDAKETGAFAILVWQAGFLLAHRFAHRTVRGILVTSILGNIVVGLGWFGTNRLAGPHPYSGLEWSLLLAVIVFNFALFLLGLAPAAWLRFRKAL